MGLFKKSAEEKEEKKSKRDMRQEKAVMFLGDALQPIGKIPVNGSCGLKLKPEERVLNIHCNKVDITLPYDRIKSFKVENEVTLAKAGSGLGGAVVGGVLLGPIGAIIGQNMKKGKTKAKWFGILTYEDKEGNIQQLSFLERGATGLYTGDKKSVTAMNFENVVNRVASDCSEDISEL